MIVALVLCGAASADTVINDTVNDTSTYYITSNNTSGSDCLPTVAHGTIQGKVYISSTAGWPGSNPDTFNVPNGTVVFARYYAGVWMGSATTTFNGHNVPITGSYSSGMGVTWVSYDVIDYVIPGELNTATSTSSGTDGRQYGNTLVVVLQNDTDPTIEYWITEGLDWLNYNPPSVDWSNTTISGIVNLNAIQNASLYSVHLTGYNYEDLNGFILPTPTEYVAGGYFDALRWDNIQGLLVAENQSINVGRGEDTYASPVFHALTIEYETYDLVPINLTPNVVAPHTSNTLTATIENRGTTDSSAFNVSLLVDGVVEDTQPVNGLASGGTTTVDFHWTPDDAKYKYTLSTNVDSENVVNETDETNNILNTLVGSTAAPTPVAEFTVTPTSGDAPLTVSFTDQSSDSTISWAWDFNNDGITDSTKQNPTYTYEIPGTYTVKLTITNGGGIDEEIKTDYITVISITPVADFTANTTNGLVPFTVQFTDTSTHVPNGWLWDFGDGTTSTAQNPTHTYNTLGTYTVKLTVRNAAGSDDETKTDYITVQAVTPVANFTVTPDLGFPPLTVQFTDTSANNPTSWAWDFNNDGIVDSTLQNPTYTYNALGNYTVKLTVTNLAGSDDEVKTSYVRVVNGIEPVAEFTATPTKGNSSLTVQFNDQSTNGSSEHVKTQTWWVGTDCEPDQYVSTSWSFPQTVDLTGANSLTFHYWFYGGGDGSALGQLSIGNNIIWEVGYSGEYDSGWNLATIDTSSYTGLQTLTFNYSMSVMGPGGAGLNLKDISAIGTDSITSWLWDFGDGTNSTEQNPTHNYSTAGIYTVKLTATSAVDSDEEVKPDYITVKPIADFSASPISGDGPLTVQFTDNSTGATGWIWDFNNDGIVDSTLQNPTWNYSSPGYYTVKLTATSPGVSDEEIKTNCIFVNGPDLVVTSITTNSGTGNSLFSNGSNEISVTVQNQGNRPVGTSILKVNIVGEDYIVNVPALGVGESTTVSVTDYTSRSIDDNIPVNTDTDPNNTIPETNDSNNTLSTTLTVYNNGYRGKRYTNGNDINTNTEWSGYYNIIYSNGNSTYRSGSGSNWDTPYTVNWTSSDLSIPNGANVVLARLYQPYTWNTALGVPDWTAKFNGKTLYDLTYYTDTKAYGSSNYPSGLLIYNVTQLFQTNGNTLTLIKGSNTTASLYGSYLVVIYEDSTTTFKRIYINDGADMLCSNPTYGVQNNEEATAYARYNLNTDKMSNTQLVAILASAGDANKSKLFFNGQEYSGFWDDYNGTTQTGFSIYDITSSILNGANTAALQSYNNGTNGDNMLALGTILVITTDKETPIVNADIHGGLSHTSQTVTLTATDDQCTNPKIYYTLNGEEPTTNCSLYTVPILINETTTLKFMAVDDLGNTSPAQTEIYTIDTIAPSVTSFDPLNGKTNITPNKKITINFNEAIKAGKNFWIELVNSAGTAIPFTTSINGNVLTVDPTSNLSESRYKLMLHTGSITDLAGNPLTGKSTTFTIGTSPTIATSDPKNGATGITRNKAIKVKFNENIKAGKNYWIELVTSNGTAVTITNSISGKTLTINHAKLKANTKYYLKLHTGCVTDTAGNPLAAKTISFTTGNT